MMWLIHMWVPITHIIIIMTHYIPTLTIRSSCKTIANTIVSKGSLHTIVLTLVHICIVSSICIVFLGLIVTASDRRSPRAHP